MAEKTAQRPIVVGMSGASGAVYGVQLLKVLKRLGLASHLVISEAARLTLRHETGYSPEEVCALADVCHDARDIGAAIASGSFLTAGMVVAPCSIKTLSAVANSHADNLLARAADVHLKEARPLILMVRETPLHAGHLELMLKAARLGAVILPPMPAFYHQPAGIDDIVNQSLGKVLDRLGIEHNLFRRWEG